MRPRRDAGMTLVEMLVALAILSVIGVAGLTMLDTTLNVQRRTEGRLDRVEEIDRALTVLRRDFATAAPGLTLLEGEALTFLRAAEEAPLTLTVGLEDGRLTRLVQRAQTTGRSEPQQLLTGVREVRWRLLDGARRWQSDWPEAEAPPRAAELTLRLDLPESVAPGEVTRLFPMPAGATP